MKVLHKDTGLMFEAKEEDLSLDEEKTFLSVPETLFANEDQADEESSM